MQELSRKEKAVKNANAVVNNNKKLRDDMHGRFNRCFALVSYDGGIWRVKATKRGAETALKKDKLNTYYDDMTMEMKSVGDGYQIVKIKEEELLPLDSKQLYYNQLWHDYRHLAGGTVNRRKYEYWIKEYNLSDEITEMITSRFDEMERGTFTPIEELEDNKTETAR